MSMRVKPEGVGKAEAEDAMDEEKDLMPALNVADTQAD